MKHILIPLSVLLLFICCGDPKVMGGIDLDPASDREAQKVVKAETFYSENMDGIRLRWEGRVWLNPPWSLPQPWLRKLG